MAPSVEQNTDYPISASKSGYISDTTTIIILDSTTPVGDQLVISSPSSVQEGNSFQVTVTTNDLPVEEVTLIFDDNTFETVSDGTVTLSAPDVDQDTEYSISASKTGFQSASALITVLNQEIVISEGYIFGTISDNSGEYIDNAMVCIIISDKSNVITSKCSHTDENGGYTITISVGTYSIQASKYGYITSTVDNVVVNADEGKEVDFLLQKIVEEKPETLVDYTIKEKIQQGAVIGTVDVTSETSQVNIYDDINIELISSDITSKQGVNVIVSGEEDTPGTNIVIYLGEIKNPDTIVVTYDGVEIEKSKEVESFFDKENENTAWILVPVEEKGVTSYLVIFKISHFSQHKISITLEEIIDILSGPTAAMLFILYLAIIGVFIVGMATVRRRI
jgi:hypothetical protein